MGLAGNLTGFGQCTSSYITKENDSLFPGNTLTVTSSRESGISWATSSFMMEYWWTQSDTSLVQVTVTAAGSWWPVAMLLCSEDSIYSTLSHSPALTFIFFPTPLQCSLGVGEGDIDVLFRAWGLAIILSTWTSCEALPYLLYIAERNFSDQGWNYTCLWIKQVFLQDFCNIPIYLENYGFTSQKLGSLQPWAFEQVYSTKHEFPLTELVSFTIRPWLVAYNTHATITLVSVSSW